MIDAVNTLNSLAEAHPDAESYVHNHALIRSTQLQRGLKLYNKAIVASLGAMLRNGEPGRADGTGRWNDVAGQYVPRREVKRILDAIANGGIDSLEGIDRAFGRIAADYDHYARSWAEGVLVQLLGHAPSPEEIAEARQPESEPAKHSINPPKTTGPATARPPWPSDTAWMPIRRRRKCRTTTP